MTQLKNTIESLLFSAGKRLTVEELGRLCREENLDAIRAALELLRKELDDKQSPLMLVQEGDGWKLTVREQYVPVVRKVIKTPELPKSLLETLAVVAYKAPVLQSQVIKIRTNKAYKHLDELEELGYLSREKKGRTKLIKLTQKFFDYFDIPPEKLKEKFKNAAVLEKVIEEKEKSIEQSHKAIIAAAKEPQVEPVTEEPPLFAKGIEPYDAKIGELEVYREEKPRKKRKKPAAHETIEKEGEKLAEEILAETPKPPEEAAEEPPEGERLTVERIKREASAEKPAKTEYVPKGLFAKGIPQEVQELIEHRVKELMQGMPEQPEEGEEAPEIPATTPASTEEAEKEPAEETTAEEAEQEETEEEAQSEPAVEEDEQETAKGAEQSEQPPAGQDEIEDTEQTSTQTNEVHEPPKPEEKPKKHKKHH